MFKILTLLPLLLFSSCKTGSHIHSPTHENSNLSTLQESLDKNQECKTSNGKVQQLPFPVVFENEETHSKEEQDLYLKTLTQSLSTLPPSLLNSFADIKGSIVLVEDTSPYCPVPDDTKDSYPNGIASCWEQDEDQNTLLFISILDEKGFPTLTALSYNVLTSFGQMFEKIFLNHMVISQGEMFPQGGQYANDGAEAYRFEVAQEILDKVETDEPIPFDDELSSFALSHSFFSYYCNEKTRSTLSDLFPKSYQTIKDLTDHYQAKDVRNEDSQSLGLKNPFERLSKYVAKKAIKRIREMNLRLATIKPKKLKPATREAMTMERANEILRTNTKKPEEAVDGLSTSDNIMKGRYYNGTPRLIRANPNAEHKGPVTILIHGTFSAETVTSKALPNTWCHLEEKGGVAELIGEKMNEGGGEVVAFQWGGRLSDKERMQAGKELADIIEAYHALGIEVNLVGYSHGANVAAAALHNLQGTEVKIANMISLGKPVMRSSRYSFSMSQISGKYLFVKGRTDFVPATTLNNLTERSGIKKGEKKQGDGEYIKVTIKDLKSSYHSHLVTAPVMGKVLEVLETGNKVQGVNIKKAVSN